MQSLFRSRKSSTDLERLEDILRELNLPEGQWALKGSGVMVLHGIPLASERRMGDIDIFLATRPWLDLQKDTSWSVFSTNPNDPIRRSDPPYLYKVINGVQVDMFHSWRSRYNYDHFDVSRLITEAEMVRGWPCVSLGHLYSFKIGRYYQRRAIKDLKDAEAIKEYLRR